MRQDSDIEDSRMVLESPLSAGSPEVTVSRN